MRKFGIEVEMDLPVGLSIGDVLSALRTEGLTSATSLHSYVGHSNSEWVVKTDGSVPGGFELVSPPLDFDDEHQRKQVTRAIQVLQNLRCRTTPSAGIHIHVESRGMEAEQIGSVARTFAHFEDVLFRLASSGWRTIRAGARQYARPMSDRQYASLARAKTEQQVMNAYYGRGGGVFTSSHGHHSRYCALNLHSHFYRRTIEFRMFNTSLNPMRVQTYVAVCLAIVQDAKNGKKRSVQKRYKLGGMADGTTDPEKAFFNFLTVVRYHAGMSLEDYRNLKKIWKDSLPQQSMPPVVVGY